MKGTNKSKELCFCLLKEWQPRSFCRCRGINVILCAAPRWVDFYEESKLNEPARKRCVILFVSAPASLPLKVRFGILGP